MPDPKMDTIRIPACDLEISKVIFGCEPLGGSDWGSVDPSKIADAVRRAVDLGINAFDTADVYGLGKSEERLGAALGSDRNNVVVITKVGIRWDTNADGSRARTCKDGRESWIAPAVDNSLRRLRLEQIPILLLHWPDPETPLSESVGALERLREIGKVRHIGLSNVSAEQIRQVHRSARLSVVEAEYSLVNRRCESDLLKTCNQLGIGVLAFGCLAQGLLTGKYDLRSSFGDDDRRHRLPHFQPDVRQIHLTHIVDRVRQTARDAGRSPAQIALRWVLDNPGISAVIAGAKSPEQVTENAGASGWTLSPETRAQLDAD